jgi:hypothetical protein
MAILWPGAIGKPDDAAIFASGKDAYLLNRGLDLNKDGAVTKAEAASRVAQLLQTGLLPENSIETADAVAAPSPPKQEAPVGALAPIFLQTILPLILSKFSPRAQATISQATGGSPDATAAFLQNLIAQVSGAAGVQIPPGDTPEARTAAIQAVAAVTKPDATDKILQLEQHALDYLDKLSPMLDKLAAMELANRSASVAGMDAAAARAKGEQWDMTRWLVWIAGFTATMIVLGLTSTLIYQAVTGEHQIDNGLIGIAGPLLAISLGVWREIFAYRFDGSKNSDAQTALAQTITDASKKGATVGTVAP